MTTLQQVTAADQALARLNENFGSVSPAGLYAKKPSTTTGLTLGYYGGFFGGNTVADGTIALGASQAAVYVVAARADGTVSQSTGTTDWNDSTDFFRVGLAVTGATTITTWTDYREAYAAPVGGGGGGAVSSVNAQTGAVVLDSDDISEGAANLYYTEERVQDAVVAQLIAGTNITLTPDTSGGLTIDAAGGGGVTDFTDLGDVPASYTGQSLKAVRVNTGETALEFYTPAGGGTPAGSTTEIQYNNAGAFGSEAAFTYDASTNTLTADKINTAKGADITRATTTDIGAATGNYVHLTGTTTITGLGTVAAGATRIVKFTGAGTLTHNATSLILPGAASITTAANDCALFASLGSGNWQCIAYSKASGLAVIAAAAGASLTNWTGSLNTSSPNNTVNAARLLVTGGTTNGDAVIQPKGTGAFLLNLPDAATPGGDKRGAYAVDLQLIRAASTNVAVGISSFLGAGESNSASNPHSSVVAGKLNAATADYSFIGGGAFNTASGDYSGVIAGASNIASGASSVAAGSSNSAGGASSAAVGGANNTASGDFSRAGGTSSSARGIRGADVYSSINTGTVGQIQRGAYCLNVTTSNATTTEMTADGSAGTSVNQILVPDSSAYVFEGIVIARKGSSNDHKSWSFIGSVNRDSGAATIALAAAVTPTVIANSAGASSWTLAVTVDTTNGTLRVNATGAAASSIIWSANVRTAEITS